MERFQEFNRHKTLLTVRVAEVSVVPSHVVLVPNFGDGREKNTDRYIGSDGDSSILSSSFQCFRAKVYSSKVRHELL